MAEVRILIVEDEGIEALDLEYRLESMGYAIQGIVATGEEAVDKAEELRPDLILMDIMLQGEIDGVTAAERIRARLDIPVIFLTAYADEKTLQRAKITEPYGYLVKPFQERELYITIDMALYKHRMERKLKERERFLFTTLRSIGDAVIATDEHGLITFMNPVAEGLMGLTLTEVRDQKLVEIFNIINKSSRLPVENPITRVLREGCVVGLANHTILIASNGKEIPIDDSAAPIKDDRGNIIGVVLVFRDITEREEAEQEVQHHVTELESVNQELDAFSYAISHDLKAPLRSIKVFSQAIVEDHGHSLDEVGKDYLRRVIAASERMSQLIDAMLAMSRSSKRELEKQTVNLSAMARVISQELQQKDPGRQVEFTIADNLKVQGDRIMLETVMENLLHNAWKFTGRSAAAKIEFGMVECGAAIDKAECGTEPTRQEACGPRNELLLEREGQGRAVYYVRDNGVGFDMHHADKLFKPFHRLHSDKEFEGTGIGLATVHRIISRHGEKIWVEAAPGQGTTLYFTLG